MSGDTPRTGAFASVPITRLPQATKTVPLMGSRASYG